MAWSRKSLTLIAAQVIYLAGLVAGGLHYHAHQDGHTSDDASRHAAFDAASAEPGCDDEHDCSICAAIHLAKAPPPDAVSVAHCTLAEDMLACMVALPVLISPRAARARAPPL